jgi:hypothetical protein
MIYGRICQGVQGVPEVLFSDSTRDSMWLSGIRMRSYYSGQYVRYVRRYPSGDHAISRPYYGYTSMDGNGVAYRVEIREETEE